MKRSLGHFIWGRSSELKKLKNAGMVKRGVAHIDRIQDWGPTNRRTDGRTDGQREV